MYPLDQGGLPSSPCQGGGERYSCLACTDYNRIVVCCWSHLLSSPCVLSTVRHVLSPITLSFLLPIRYTLGGSQAEMYLAVPGTSQKIFAFLTLLANDAGNAMACQGTRKGHPYHVTDGPAKPYHGRGRACPCPGFSADSPPNRIRQQRLPYV